MKKLIPFLILSVMVVVVGTMAFTPAFSASRTDREAPFLPGLQPEAEPTVAGTDKQAPFVDWISPAANGEIYQVDTETIELVVDARDNVAVEKVQFFRWDAANDRYVDIGLSYFPPYKWDLESSSLNKDWNQIFVQAFDIAGNASEKQHIWLRVIEAGPRVPLYLPYLSREATAYTLP